MQRKAAPQSPSKVHCATAGCGSSTQAPLAQIWPTGHSVEAAQPAWQRESRQTRPLPQSALTPQVARPAEPQVVAPEA